MRGAQPWRTNRARVLRSRATSAEDRMWSALRNRRLNGLKFVRQCSIGPYFVDFVCRERKIIVEIDGATHSIPRLIEDWEEIPCLWWLDGFRWGHDSGRLSQRRGS